MQYLLPQAKLGEMAQQRLVGTGRMATDTKLFPAPDRPGFQRSNRRRRPGSPSGPNLAAGVMLGQPPGQPPVGGDDLPAMLQKIQRRGIVPIDPARGLLILSITQEQPLLQTLKCKEKHLILMENHVIFTVLPRFLPCHFHEPSRG